MAEMGRARRRSAHAADVPTVPGRAWRAA